MSWRHTDQLADSLAYQPTTNVSEAIKRMNTKQKMVVAWKFEQQSSTAHGVEYR
jgi:hypothetical protein